MNIDQLRQQFPEAHTCGKFFETARWTNGRICLLADVIPVLYFIK